MNIDLVFFCLRKTAKTTEFATNFVVIMQMRIQRFWFLPNHLNFC